MWKPFGSCLLNSTADPVQFKEDERWGRPVRCGGGGGWRPPRNSLVQFGWQWARLDVLFSTITITIETHALAFLKHITLVIGSVNHESDLKDRIILKLNFACGF